MGKGDVRSVAKDIGSLKVQGARRIAKAALLALMRAGDKSKAKDADTFYSDLLSASRELAESRPTEPMMRNALSDSLRFCLAHIHAHPSREVSQLKAALHTHQDHILYGMDQAAEKIARHGAEQIAPGANILVHCHSSTLVRMLIRAQEEGKHPRVTCLETRPLFQGRLTARELADAGVKTALAVDSSAGSLMPGMDMVFVGADAITAGGDLVNKIGTHTLAQLADRHSVRFLCAAELYKYDPLTLFGRTEPIEERAAAEVWGDGRYAKEKNGKRKTLDVPAGLRILNPAFDLTPARLIGAYITEEGRVSPAQLPGIAQRKLRLKN